MLQDRQTSPAQSPFANSENSGIPISERQKKLMKVAPHGKHTGNLPDPKIDTMHASNGHTEDLIRGMKPGKSD